MTLEAGFAPVFAGWNVWSLWMAEEPDHDLLGTIWNAGISNDRLLRIWVENQIDDNAPGAEVGDPLSPNPKKFKGELVQIIPSANGLAPMAMRVDVPGLAGAQQLGVQGSGARLVHVRFYNRGAESALPWPHDGNFLVENVYQPSAQNPITNAPAPDSFGGDLDKLGAGLGQSLEVVAWIGGAVLAVVILSKLGGNK